MRTALKVLFVGGWLGLGGSLLLRAQVPGEGTKVRAEFIRNCSSGLTEPLCVCFADQTDRMERWPDLQRWERGQSARYEPWMIAALGECEHIIPAGTWPPQLVAAFQQDCLKDSEHTEAFCQCTMEAVKRQVSWYAFITDSEAIAEAGEEAVSCSTHLAGPNGEWPASTVSRLTETCGLTASPAWCRCRTQLLTRAVRFDDFVRASDDEISALTMRIDASASRKCGAPASKRREMRE